MGLGVTRRILALVGLDSLMTFRRNEGLLAGVFTLGGLKGLLNFNANGSPLLLGRSIAIFRGGRATGGRAGGFSAVVSSASTITTYFPKT